MDRLPTVPVRGGLLTAHRADLLAARLPHLRSVLLRRRDYRREQLAELDVHERSGRASKWRAGQGAACDSEAPVREVQALVAAGARRALADIELALARIATGDYGRCRECGAGISLAVLEAIPQTTLCLSCHRRYEEAAGPA